MKRISKILLFSILSVIFCGNLISVASDSNQETTKALLSDEARQNYKVYLEQLKVLNSQYKEITSGMKELIKEEGYPVWDENTGGLTISHDLSPVNETDKEMTVILELPGLQKESLRVHIQDQKILQISGKRKSDKQIVERSIELPAMAGGKAPSARYEDGILTVQITKLTPSKTDIAVAVQPIES